MKVIICNKIKESDPDYFKRTWRIPYRELELLGWISVDQSEIKGKLPDFFMEKYRELPTVLFFWNTNTFISHNILDITQHKWTKCIYMDDLHQTSGKIIQFRNQILEKFDYVFSTYAYVFSTFYPMAIPSKIIWYPHNVNSNFVTEFNENPLNKVLVSGCLDKNIYPFRYHVSKLSKKYPVDVLQQLSYSKVNHQFYGHNYIKYIGKYIAAIACCSNSKTPYIVNKFFEIPASGALLLAYDEFVVNPLRELGFIDGENYISVNFTNIVDKINYVLDPNNKNIIDSIRRKGYDLVWNSHTLTHRAKMVNDVTNKVVDKN